MIESFEQFFSGIDPYTAYVILFISAFVENVFPPIPGDTVTVLGAYLAATGQLGFWGVYFSTTLGSVVGFFAMYLVGRYSGRAFLQSRFRARIFSEKQLQKVQKWFAKYGNLVIIGNRFLSGTRSVISLFAGFFHLNALIVFILALISALVWNGLLIYGGYLLGLNWQTIMGIIGNYNRLVLILTAIVIVAIVFWRWKRKSTRETA